MAALPYCTADLIVQPGQLLTDWQWHEVPSGPKELSDLRFEGTQAMSGSKTKVQASERGAGAADLEIETPHVNAQ